ncbi:uncharacterized protein LOC111284088 [Durio zibethinus]|uniref:Uncharacterized protein LOC111284088 n=1 Tax=Durio zibethinus TaxID=66656 RepID=A0A6P5XK40_DURZI|nr:uncharacterized protein LOC111284088 [Durio zibethinus]
MVFSGGSPTLLLDMAVTTKQSPDGTALTLPFVPTRGPSC